MVTEMISKKTIFSKPAIWGISSTASLLLLLVVAGRYYISSEAFSTYLSSNITEMTGKEVAISKPIEWETIVPTLSANIPNISFTSHSETKGGTRLQLRNTHISIPFQFNFKKEQLADLHINIDRLAAIVTSTSADENEEEVKFSPPDVINYMPLAFQNNLSINIAQFEIVFRTESGVYDQHKINNVALVSNDSNIHLSGEYVEKSGIKQPWNIQFQQKDAEEGHKRGIVLARMKFNPILDEKLLSLTSSYSLNHSSFSFPDIKVKHGENEALADIEVGFKPQSFKGDIFVRKWALDKTPKHKEVAKEARLFSDKLLPYAFLTSTDIDLRIRAGAVRYKGLPVINGAMQFNSSGSDASLFTEKLAFLGAPAKIQWEGSNFHSQPQFQLYAEVKGLTLDRFAILSDGDGFFDSGVMGASTRLTYDGSSLKDHATGLSGEFVLYALDSGLTPAFGKWIDQGVVSLGKRLTTLEEGETSYIVPCMNARIILKNGFGASDRSIVMETPDNLVTSSGYVNFHTEKIGFTFASNTKRTFDWSPISTLKYFQISGSLSAPSVRLNPIETAKKGIMAATSLIFGPIPPLAYAAIEASQQMAAVDPICTPLVHLSSIDHLRKAPGTD